jgi:hypothetical protein
MNRMNRLLRRGFGPFGRRIAAWSAAALMAMAPAFHTGCMGGTTGVDNPGLARLPVDFRDAAGHPAAVQGMLEIYDREHNPAVDSGPLLRVAVGNDAGVILTGEEFDRIGSARMAKYAGANWKRAAGAGRNAAAGGAAGGAALMDGADSLIRFNLVFRSGTASGAVATGLSYDPVAKVFRLDSAVAGDAVRLTPRPLLRFAARIRSGAIPGPGRVFLPGTPFQATLVDSDFALQGLPEGRFGMRLLGDQGYVYAVRETLDTRAVGPFTAEPDPIGRIGASLAPAGFAVEALGPLDAYAQQSIGLTGRVLGADSNDSRISVLWRPLRAQSVDSARIDEPTRLNAQILFPATGGYAVELSATLGATTVRDTLQIKVSLAPAPTKFSIPLGGDSLKMGQTYKLLWSTSLAGKGRLEYSYKNGEAGSWVVAADSVALVPGTASAPWTTPVIGSVVTPCLLRLLLIPSDSLLAQTPAPFFLVP